MSTTECDSDRGVSPTALSLGVAAQRPECTDFACNARVTVTRGWRGLWLEYVDALDRLIRH